MKKKKIKKMIEELTDKFERELDVEVDLLKKRIDHIDERTMALDNVKVQKTLDKTKELDDKIKILMNKTTIDYSKMSSQEISYQECISLIYCMRDRGAMKEEINGVKKLMNKYIFRSRLFLVDDEVTTPEEIIDGKKEA